MKNIFKKNQIIIVALAIMLIIAGYLNFSGKNVTDKTADVTSNDVLDYDTYSETAKDDITDGTTVSEDTESAGVDLATDTADVAETTGTIDETAQAETGDETAKADTDTEEVAKLDVSDTGEVSVDADTSGTGKKTADASSDDSTPGEAILVSTTIASNYFANAKLEREQKRSVSKETLMELVNNKNISEKEKADAVKSVMDLTAKADLENDTETLLEAKGYSDAIVIMSEEGTVDVIINATSVTDQDIAKVEDIVKRQTGAEASDIVISPVVVEE